MENGPGRGIFWGIKEKVNQFLFFIIVSSPLGGVLFWMKKAGIPKIVFPILDPIALEEEAEADRFLLLTINH